MTSAASDHSGGLRLVCGVR